MKINAEKINPSFFSKKDGQFSRSARGVANLNDRSVSSSKTEVRSGIKAEKHTYFHQLNGRNLLVVFISTISKGL
jgi:hypothetical protein